MICFRCHKGNNDLVTYTYPSLWIVNTNDPIIGSLSEDFKLEEVHLDQVSIFYKLIKKLDPETVNLIGEVYVH